MKRLLCVLLLVIGGSTELSAQEVGFPDGIAVGDVMPDAAIVWTRSPGAAYQTQIPVER